MICEPKVIDKLKNILEKDNWDLESRDKSKVIFKKKGTNYDYVEVYAPTFRGYKIVTPLRSSRFSYTTFINDSLQVIKYVSKFIFGYNEPAKSR